MFAYNLFITIILLIIFDFAWSAAIPINWAIAMDITNPKIGASELSIIYSISNLGDVGAGAVAGTLVVIMGFQNVFLLSGILLIPAIITLHMLNLNNIKH
jgi:MFS family permease